MTYHQSYRSTRKPWWLNWFLLLASLVPTLTVVDAQPIFYAAQKPDAFDALVTGVNNIDVYHVDGAYWAWITRNTPQNVGVIFYTALWYDERAYSRIMQRVASSNFPCFLLDIPLSMPFLTPYRGDVVIRDFPEIQYWVVAGHGIGGAMASVFAQRRREEGVDGLALFGSYPFPIFNDQSLTNIKAISLWGNRDGITSRVQWEDGRNFLPRDARFIEIDGANHSQMARLQVDLVCNDNEAAISRDEQENIVVSELINLLVWVQSGTRIPTNNPSRQPSVNPSNSPTMTPSFRPTATPSAFPTISMAPTLSLAPSESPTIMTIKTVPSRFGYGFELDTELRAPTAEEIGGLVDETEMFFELLIQEAFPNNIISLEINNFEGIFQPEIERLPFVLDFDVVVEFEIPQNGVSVPQVDQLFAAMEAYDETRYIEGFVREAEPDESIFHEVVDTEFAMRGGVVRE